MAWFRPMAVVGTVARPARTSTSTAVSALAARAAGVAARAAGGAVGVARSAGGTVAACAAGGAVTVAATATSRAVLAKARRRIEICTVTPAGGEGFGSAPILTPAATGVNGFRCDINASAPTTARVRRSAAVAQAVAERVERAGAIRPRDRHRQ